MRRGHALALRAGASSSRDLVPSPAGLPSRRSAQPSRSAHAPCPSPPRSARPFPEVTPSPQSLVPARAARSRQRGGGRPLGRGGPCRSFPEEVAAPPPLPPSLFAFLSGAAEGRAARTGWGRFPAQAQGPVNRKRRRPRAAETKGLRRGGSKDSGWLGLARPSERGSWRRAAGWCRRMGRRRWRSPKAAPTRLECPVLP